MIEGITDKQALFNHVCRHLFAQHAKAIELLDIGGGVKTPACRYRANSGYKCAVGCLIEDREYHTEMESTPIELVLPAIERSIGRTLKIGSNDDYSEKELLISLQEVHDRHAIMDWPESLEVTARNHNLEFTFTKADWKECVTCH